jgi:hypothetical protein
MVLEILQRISSFVAVPYMLSDLTNWKYVGSQHEVILRTGTASDLRMVLLAIL